MCHTDRARELLEQSADIVIKQLKERRVNNTDNSKKPKNRKRKRPPGPGEHGPAGRKCKRRLHLCTAVGLPEGAETVPEEQKAVF